MLHTTYLFLLIHLILAHPKAIRLRCSSNFEAAPVGPPSAVYSATSFSCLFRGRGTILSAWLALQLASCRTAEGVRASGTEPPCSPLLPRHPKPLRMPP